MPLKSKWNYKGKKLVETRTREGPGAREQAVISLGPALEWNPQEGFEVETELRLCSWTQTRMTSRHPWSSQESLFSEQQNCLPKAGEDSQSKIYQSFWPESHVSAPSAAIQPPTVLLLKVSVSYTLFNYFSPLLFPSYTTFVWKNPIF